MELILAYQFLQIKGNYNAYLKLQSSALDENINYISKAINEIILNTIYDEKKVSVILNQVKNNVKENIIQNGMYIAMIEAQAVDVKSAKLRSNLIGKNRYEFLNQAITNVADFISNLEKVIKRVFNKNNMLVSFSGSKETIKALKKEVSLFELESKENVQALDVCLNSKIKRALVIPSEDFI